ncbi:MAG: hypothetical protein J3R72DRAFT_252885 [Linnemannia gamsii]|nr:MAG: hypothetical protein J3R72DRAFT_252885 [Linnemannia gamsii]
MNASTMISTTTISHPPNLSIPSPKSPSSPSPASPPSLSFGGPHNQNNNSRPLLTSRSSSTSHCPPMLPRPRSYSSDPIPGATPMSSSTSFSNLLTPNHHKVNPNIAHLSSVAMNMSRRPSLPANHPLMHHHHPMERQRSYDPRRQPPGFYLQQQALLQEQFEQQQQQEQQGLQAQQQQLQQASAPSPTPVPLQRPALTPLSPPRSLSSLSSTSTMVSSLSSSSISSTLSSSTLTTVSTTVRHPLWQLDCKSCKTTLCKQAMLGHLAGDPDKKLFSTNLTVG